MRDYAAEGRVRLAAFQAQEAEDQAAADAAFDRTFAGDYPDSHVLLWKQGYKAALREARAERWGQ